MDAASDCFVTSFSQDQISVGADAAERLCRVGYWKAIPSPAQAPAAPSATLRQGTEALRHEAGRFFCKQGQGNASIVLGGEGTVADTTQKPEKTEVFTPTTDPNAAVSEVPAESVPEEVPADSVLEETVPADQPADAVSSLPTPRRRPEAPAEGETGGDTRRSSVCTPRPNAGRGGTGCIVHLQCGFSIWGAIQDAASQQNDAA